MIRLSYPSAASGQRTLEFKRGVVRFGTGASCELRLPKAPGVQPKHGQFSWEGGVCSVAVVDERFALTVNGKRGRRFALKGGERIGLGASGLEIRLLEVRAPARDEVDEPTATEGVPIDAPDSLGHWLKQAKRDIDEARGEALGQSSGHTMIIMAKALKGVKATAEGRSRSIRRKLVAVAALSAMVIAGLVGVIWVQHRRINALVAEKAVIDDQIQGVLTAMEGEDDEERLAALEGKLELLVGSASEKLAEVKKANADRAEELAQPSDDLDAEIRKILHSFHADTYAIPPVFRRALREQVDGLRSSAGLKGALARKRQVWPDVQRALRRRRLPIELGYIAFTESTFDPTAVNSKSGAAGMWQLMAEVARNCGLEVTPKLDERLDPAKSSEGAACYLSNLMVEFGEESFMLSLASYNRGENGVRRALHKLAQEPGGFRKRDFWHLYRLKYLPKETREYVPKVLAAAIVMGGGR
ncbi:MAG: lytic transglycosylase domain-containing protein [Archangiaceae bacterium]|nr:lytic transglycosylase domain-containing protein [Archangiaceae bacterium]